MKRKWLLVALLNLLVAASLGSLLRFAFVEELAWMKYRYVLHGHSHVALLGWIYLALYTLLIRSFLPPDRANHPKYNRLFWLTQLSVIGMMGAFPWQGYGAISIAFSMAHVLCSYVFLYWFWRDLAGRACFSHLLLRSALVFYFLSTLGVWAVVPMIIGSLKGSVWYYMGVQFYLHFQFNGWAIFASLALFFRWLEERGQVFSPSIVRPFYGLLIISCLLTYALAVAWSQPYLIVFVVNGLGVMLQLGALFFLVRLLHSARSQVGALLSSRGGLLLQIAFYSFVFKILIQSAVVIPFVARAAYTIRNYVIGFIHLLLLGAVTLGLVAFALNSNLLRGETNVGRLGIVVFTAGFVLSELVLFLQGTMLWAGWGFLPSYYELIFGISVLLPLGVAILIMGQRRWSNVSSGKVIG